MNNYILSHLLHSLHSILLLNDQQKQAVNIISTKILTNELLQEILRKMLSEMSLAKQSKNTEYAAQ